MLYPTHVGDPCPECDGTLEPVYLNTPTRCFWELYEKYVALSSLPHEEGGSIYQHIQDALEHLIHYLGAHHRLADLNAEQNRHSEATQMVARIYDHLDQELKGEPL